MSLSTTFPDHPFRSYPLRADCNSRHCKHISILSLSWFVAWYSFFVRNRSHITMSYIITQLLGYCVCVGGLYNSIRLCTGIYSYEFNKFLSLYMILFICIFFMTTVEIVHLCCVLCTFFTAKGLFHSSQQCVSRFQSCDLKSQT